MTTWLDIRAHYERLFGASKLTQEAVAENGGLYGNNAISKLLANHGLGPRVDTFVRAVQGLGMPLSEFFRALEGQPHGSSRPSVHHLSAIDQEALELGRAIQRARPRRKS